jgi:ABC-type transporter Mla MlaB component
MNCSLEQSEGNATLHIAGSMTIEDAATLKTTLVGTLADSSLIEVDLSAADETDLSCLQVLCSARRAAVHAGKKLVILRTTDSLLTCLEDAGFPRQSGCLQQDGEPCLWQEVKRS